VSDAVSLHVFVFWQIVECINASLGETVIASSTLHHLSKSLSDDLSRYSNKYLNKSINQNSNTNSESFFSNQK